MEPLFSKIVSAVVKGLIAGLITALLLFVIFALIPRAEIDAGFWGAIVGIIYAIYVFVTDRE